MIAPTCFGFIFVMWCNVQDPALSGAQFCDIYKPVKWAAEDTRHTKEQVDVLNRQWKVLCRKKP